MKAKQVIGLILAAIIVFSTSAFGFIITKNLTDTTENFTDNLGRGSYFELPGGGDYLTLIKVCGEISETDSTNSYFSSEEYDHSKTLQLIDALEYDDSNVGILLYMDTPGGSVYASDELYQKLMQYKLYTGRPIYCYYASQSCSGGVYVSMAADEICANRNTMTGSIGVIMRFFDMTGLYDKLGIREVNIASGRNKAMGSAGQTLTDEQREILQSYVDESYIQFVDIVAGGRDLDPDKVREFADGRILSASDALEVGMIDRIDTYENYLYYVFSDIGDDVDLYTPSMYESTLFDSLFGAAEDLSRSFKSDTEALGELAEQKQNGLYYICDIAS